MEGVDAFQRVERLPKGRCAGNALGIVAHEGGVEIVHAEDGHFHLCRGGKAEGGEEREENAE